MKDTTKTTLRNVFGSLIKNDSAIEGAKTAPWWIAVIFFILGTFLPIIPIMVNASKTYGASYISSTQINGYEQGLATAATELKADSYEFKLNEGQLLAYKDGTLIERTWTETNGVSNDETPLFVYYTKVGELETRAFEFYYSDRPVSTTTKSITALKKAIESKKYVVGTDRLYGTDESDNKKTATFTPTYILIHKDGFYSKIFKYDTTTALAVTYDGLNWKHSNFQELLTYLLAVENVTPNLRDANYVNGVLDNMKTVANESYLDQKLKNFWFNSGLYWGIYIVLGFFMGLMMWLLTRGKTNPNRNLTIWVGFKISWWICFTPGLLAMAVGFFWSQAAGLAYIVLIGLRTMWLSMRQLNPTTQA